MDLSAPGEETAVTDDRRQPVSEVAPGVFRLVLPLGIHGIPSVNGYVIADAHAATLVDCGIWTGEAEGRGTRALEDGLSACGFSLTQVGRLIITHAHIDHYGIAGEVARHSGADVWMHQLTSLDIAKYRDPEAAVSRREQMLADHGMYGAELEGASTGLRDWMPVMPSIAEPTTWLRGGERFTARRRAWEVIHTPGHSPGHVCLWSAADGILLSGDHLLPGISSPVTFEHGFGRDPMGSYLDSLRRVAALAPALVLPGHGDPFPDGGRRAAAVERVKRRRLEKVWHIIEAEALPVTGIAERMFGRRLSGSAQHFAMAEVLAFLAYYDVRRQAQQLRGPDGVFRWSLVRTP
jgi:glyoxylase-like metal-dependent hydrolase (beta-lactamase superfamily II)